MAATNRTTGKERREQERKAKDDEAQRLRRELVDTRAELAKAQRRDAAKAVALGRGIADPARLQRIANLTETEHARCAKAGEAFNLRFAMAQAIHADKTKAGEPSIAPAPPNGPRQGAPPLTLHDVQASREAYRQRLRELGILDPAVGSYPGQLGPLGGGPIGGK